MKFQFTIYIYEISCIFALRLIKTVEALKQMNKLAIYLNASE